MILVWVCPKVADVSSVHGSWQFQSGQRASNSQNSGYFLVFEQKPKKYWINSLWLYIPSGELTVRNGKSPFLMGKSTISIAIFHCYVSSPEGNWWILESWSLMGSF